MLHLTRGANAGELGPQPEGLEQVLEEAWPGAIGRIRQDASQEIERANRAIDRLEEELATMKKDGDNLFIRYEKECDRRRKAEDDVARYQARLRLREDSTRSSSSSTQPRALSPSRLTSSTAPLSTTPTTHAAGTPPRKKRATDSGAVDSALDPYDPDNLEEGTYEEDWIGYNPPPPPPAGPLPPAQPIQADGLRLPEYVLPPKIAKPRLQALLPASVTGVLPCPLGTAPARPATRTRQWYDECDISDPRLETLYREAKLLNGRDQNTAQRIAFQRITNHNRRLRKPDVFPVEEGLPPDIQTWVGYWARNPEGIPRPIHEVHGLLLEEDINVWLWSRHVAPKQHRNEFLDVLWNIFVIPDAWAKLVADTWIVPTNQVLCDLPMDVFWEWPPQVTPRTLDSSHLARWLGQKAGVTPTRARQLLEPYADRRNRGCYYSPKAQVAHNQAEVKRACRARNNSLLAGPGTAGPTAGSLAA